MAATLRAFVSRLKPGGVLPPERFRIAEREFFATFDGTGKPHFHKGRKNQANRTLVERARAIQPWHGNCWMMGKD
jgi:hypothetical protein